jgi:hypothetical protein
MIMYRIPKKQRNLGETKIFIFYDFYIHNHNCDYRFPDGAKIIAIFADKTKAESNIEIINTPHKLRIIDFKLLH